MMRKSQLHVVVLKSIMIHTIEIKRMYVDKAYRGKGFSKIVLSELEKWCD